MVPLEEKIVTNDAALRRSQYRIVGGGVPAQSHLGVEGRPKRVSQVAGMEPNNVVGRAPVMEGSAVG